MNTETDYAFSQAKAKVESIVRMIDAYVKAEAKDDQEALDDAIKEIWDTPLEINVRSGWSEATKPLMPEEYTILLCTGGPAVRIWGKLDHNGDPETAVVQYQDFFTEWRDYLTIPMNQAEKVISFARKFSFLF